MRNAPLGTSETGVTKWPREIQWKEPKKRLRIWYYGVSGITNIKEKRIPSHTALQWIGAKLHRYASTWACTGIFFLSGPSLIQKKPPNQNLGTSNFDTQNGILKPPLTFLGLNIPNLQILPIGDIPGMSTNSIMLFHISQSCVKVGPLTLTFSASLKLSFGDIFVD